MHRDSVARLTRRLAVLALALAGAACASGAPPSGEGRRAASSALPTSERLATGMTMVPVARDARGCVQYRLHSERRPSLDALFYRTRAGDFSTIEEEAACT